MIIQCSRIAMHYKDGSMVRLSHHAGNVHYERPGPGAISEGKATLLGVISELWRVAEQRESVGAFQQCHNCRTSEATECRFGKRW